MTGVGAAKATSVINRGDRIWVWSAEDPSPFELQLSEFLLEGRPADRSGEETFHVDIYSWRGDKASAGLLRSALLPKQVELPKHSSIIFMDVGEKLSFSVPETLLMFSPRAQAGDIQVSWRNLELEYQTVLIIASLQKDHDAEGNVLAGSFDAVGLLVLLSGGVLSPHRIVSSYFSLASSKFVSGRLKVTQEGSVESAPLPFATPQTGFFDARDEKTHAALWFAGRAFLSNDTAAKIVFYVTALELLAKKNNIQNYFGRLYRGDAELKEFGIKKVMEIKSLRDDLVHQGKRVPLDADLERFVHALILDAVRSKHDFSSEEFALEILRTNEGGEAGYQ